MKTQIKCHNCQQKINVVYNKNQWVEWFRGNCETCGWKFMLKDTNFDLVQPDSNFFEIIYKFHPEKEAEKNIKIYKWKEEQRKAKLEENYWKRYKSDSSSRSRKKPWEEKAIKKEVLE